MKKGRRLKNVLGYLSFFVLITVVIMVGVMIFDMVDEYSGGNKPLIAGVMFGVIVVLALICTFVDYVRRKQSVDKPVKNILHGVERIAKGDFSVKLSPRHSFGNYDELDIIMEHINTLAAELSKVEVFRTDFIANVSHEIKTPLAVIQNYATALQGQLSDEVRTEYIKTLITAAKRLTNLVTNVLKLNKLENQEIVPAYNSVNAGELLRERLSETEEIIERKGLDFACDIDDVEICTDESFLEIVWNNLLSNAIKFTPAGGSIYVSLKEDESSLILTVRDTGCGMDAETGVRIFDKFYQGDTSHSGEGNGLGLALVKKVVDILGGEISVQSEAGVGSEFTVKLRKQESESRKQKVESKK